MRIQLVLPGLSIGGTEKMVFHLTRGLLGSGHTIQVVSLKSLGDWRDRFAKAGVEVKTLNTPDSLIQGLLDLPRVCRDLGSAIKTFQPEVLHSFLTRANVLARWVSGNQKGHVVISSLRVMEREKWFHRWAEKLFSTPRTTFTVNSQALKEYATRTLGLNPEQVVVIYNGVEPPAEVPPSEVTRLQNQWQCEGRLVVLAAGRLHRQKGFDLLIQAFSRIAERQPRALLLIAGGGQEKLRLLNEIERFQLGGTVRLIGQVEDLTPYFKIAHVFVLSSRWEGTPNVVLEAMAAGCPVIATRVGGVSEILSAPQEGLTVEPENSEALEKAVVDTLADPESARQRAAKALARSKEFSIEKMVEAHLRLYQKLLA